TYGASADADSLGGEHPMAESYWQIALRRRAGRRRVLKVLGGAGLLAGAAACASPAAPTPTAAPAAASTSAAAPTGAAGAPAPTAAPTVAAKRGGAFRYCTGGSDTP